MQTEYNPSRMQSSLQDLIASEHHLSLKEFTSVEAHRQLILPSSLWISIILRLFMIGILITGVPIFLVAIWAVISFGIRQRISQLIKKYRQLTIDSPRNATVQMKKTSKEFKKFYELNCIIWAIASVFAQYWLTALPQILVHIVLTALIYLFLTRNYACLKVMNRVSIIVLGIPFLASLFKFVINLDHPNAVYIFLSFVFYLCINGYLVWLIGYRFNVIFSKRCTSEFSKLQLIESLKHSQEKLNVEQEALISANLVIQQFYSAAAHDLRQPVYAMEIYTDMLQADPSKLDILIPKIRQSCISINAMFNDLFDFHQKQIGDAELEHSKINIADALRGLALHHEPIAASKNLGLSFKPLNGYVETIPLYFVRILSNLIANAITYTPKGRILVAARKSGAFISFEVWDTGTGIDKAGEEKIFDEFYRVNPDINKSSNLGLGLAIVKELVKRLGNAKIRVNSEIGRGTVFKLLLPIEAYSNSQ